jgi:hypothetical protein
MAKVYLGLPRRVIGFQIGREKYRDMSESFPKLFDALEEYAADKLDGIDLSQNEWYHRLRNELYHQGNGLTVVREKVDVYSTLAVLLFTNLFGFRPELPSERGSPERIRDFITLWSQLERLMLLEHVTALASFARERPKSLTNSLAQWLELGVLDQPTTERLEQLRTLRNQVVHQVGEGRTGPTARDIEDLKRIFDLLRSKIDDEERRRTRLLQQLRSEFIASHDGLSPEMVAGTVPLPVDWVNARLTDMGELWHYTLTYPGSG